MPIEAPAAPETTMPTPSAPAFADFDTAFPDGLDSPEPAPISAPAPTPAKPDAIAPAEKPAPSAPKPADKPTEKPAAPPKPAEPDDEFTPPSVGTAKELKGFAFRMSAKAKDATKQLHEVEQRLKQLEAQPPRQQQDNGALAHQLAEANKRIEQYENDLRLTKYERSTEYREKYEKPYKDSLARAYRQVKELIAYEPNPEDPDNPKERAATQSDFDEVYSLPLGQATKLAKQRFGDAATIVLQHREKIRDHMENAFAAVEEYKGKAGDYEKQNQAQMAQREAGMSQMFTQATQAYAKKFTEMVAPREGDAEGNDLLTKGAQFAGYVFGGNEGVNPVDVVKRDARAYSWLSAYPRLARDVKSLKTQLSEAQKTIEELRSSGPGRPKPSAENAPQSDKGWEDAFERDVK